VDIDAGIGISSEVPLLDRVQRGLTFLLMVLFSNKVALFFWDFVYIIVVSVVVSHQARMHSSSMLFRAMVTILLLLAIVLWGYVLGALLWRPLVALQYGKPVFGELGGEPKRVFFTKMRCASAIKFVFQPEDVETIREFGRLDVKLLEWKLKETYRKLLERKDPDKVKDLDRLWLDAWKNQILAMGFDTVSGTYQTYGQALGEDNFGVRTEPIKLQMVADFVAPIMKSVQLVVICLMASYLDGKTHLLTVIQASLGLCLMMALILLTYHAHRNAEIPLLGSALPDTPPDIQEQVRPLVGKRVRPKQILAHKRYLTLIQNFFAEILATATLINALGLLLLVGIVLLMVRVWQPASVGMILQWYKHFSIGLLIIPVALFASYHLMFLALRNARLVLAPVIVGLLAAVLPYAFTYLVGAKVDVSQVKNAVLAAFTALATGVTTAILSRVRKVVGDDEESDQTKPTDKPALATE
jgi:hypothetical protein